MSMKHIEATTKQKDGKLIAIASTEDKDRHGDNLRMKDWDLRNFLRNPVLQAGHKHDPEFTVGIATKIRIKDNQLVFEPKFHTLTQLGKDIGAMYKGGILKAWSVGFIPGAINSDEERDAKGEGDGGKNELLEISAVAIPANQECLTAAKSYGEKEATVVKEWLTEQNAETVKDDKKEIKEEKKEVKNKPRKKKVELYNPQLPASFNKVYMETKGMKQDKEVSLYRRHMGVETKDIYVNKFNIPMPLIGSYLSAPKNAIKSKALETRRFNWEGVEYPPVYGDIQLNSAKRDSLLTEGIVFYENKLAYKIYPVWGGMEMEVISSVKNKDLNTKTMNDIHVWVKENNFLRGEKFSLTGEFMTPSNKEWKDLYISTDNEKAIKRTIKLAKKDDFTSRGILMYGLPGNGKTLTGKIMLNELDCTCIWLTAKDLSHPYQSPSTLISIAYSISKDLGTTVLFMEDIDNWLDRRTTDGLKTEMDGLSENKGLITILTSNDPENLPDALLDRPGRFHDILEYNAPSADVREKMLAGFITLETKTLEDVVKRTEGYSGAYMKELVDLALMISVEDEIPLEKSIIEGINKIEKQKKLVAEIQAKRDKKETKGIENIEVKEGRVVSLKNATLIQDCIDSNKQATTALEKLLMANKPKTPEENALSGKNKKGRNPKEVKKSDDSDILQALVIKLQKVARESNSALHEAKKAKQ